MYACLRSERRFRTETRVFEQTTDKRFAYLDIFFSPTVFTRCSPTPVRSNVWSSRYVSVNGPQAHDDDDASYKSRYIFMTSSWTPNYAVCYIHVERGFLCVRILFPFEIFGFLSAIFTNRNSLNVMVKFFTAYFCVFNCIICIFLQNVEANIY